jgi:hypothetical protein
MVLALGMGMVQYCAIANPRLDDSKKSKRFVAYCM